MQPLKALAHNGCLVLDEPTDLPAGEIVYLWTAETSVGGVDEAFDADETAALHGALDDGFAAAEAGDHEDAGRFAQELLRRP